MIIVIGATGFVGRYLVDRLVRDGFNVLATGRSKAGEEFYNEKGIPFTRLDITNEEDFKDLPKNGIDAVIHLASLIPAAVKEHNAKDYLSVNAIGTYNVLEYCRRNNINRLIYTSSHFDVQGLWGSNVPIKSDAPRMIKYKGNHTLYIISKITSMDFIEHYYQEYGLSTIIFRLAGVYGYGRYESAFELFVRQASAGAPIEIWGDPSPVRDGIYIKDVVSAIRKAITNSKVTGLYNLASGKGISLEDRIKDIIKVFCPKNKSSEIVYRPEIPNGIRSYVYDISETKKALEWEPQYSYEAMLEDYKLEMERQYFEI